MEGFYIFPVFILSKVSFILVWSDAVGFHPCGPPSNQTCGVILHLIRQSCSKPWTLPFER